MAKWLSQIVQVGLPINSFNDGRRDRRDATRSRRRSATRWSCASRSASSAASRRGTTRCTRSPPRSPTRWPPAAPSCSSRARSPRSTRSSSPRSSTRSACRPACSTWCPATARSSARPSPRTPTSTWCRSPARPAPASASPSSAPRPSRRSPSSSAASRPTCCSTTSTPTASPRPSSDGVRQGVPQLRPDLLGAHPHARARPTGSTRPSRSPPRPSPRSTVGDPFAEGVAPRPAGLGRPSATACRATSRRASTRAPRSSPAASAQPEGLDTGFYVRPTVFSDVTPDMTIAQEEIFGPVLSIIPYDDEDDAVEIANDIVYGLAGGVWSADKDHADAVARRLRTGQVEVNGGAFNPNAPFGGYKQSGIGREYGTLRPRGVPRDQEPSSSSQLYTRARTAVAVRASSRLSGGPRGGRRRSSPGRGVAGSPRRR